MTASWAPSTPPGAQPVSSGLRTSVPVSGVSSTEDERTWRSKPCEIALQRESHTCETPSLRDGS
jgi:hypothetical protein